MIGTNKGTCGELSRSIQIFMVSSTGLPLSPLPPPLLDRSEQRETFDSPLPDEVEACRRYSKQVEPHAPHGWREYGKRCFLRSLISKLCLVRSVAEAKVQGLDAIPT